MVKIPIINQIIKDKRRELNINQENFGKMINKSLPTVKKYDTGTLIPENTLLLICGCLKINLEELLNKQLEENKQNNTSFYSKIIKKRKKNVSCNIFDMFGTVISDRYQKMIEEQVDFILFKEKRYPLILNNFFLSFDYSLKCEYQELEKKFYIKGIPDNNILFILTISEIENLIKDMKKYFEFLLDKIEQSKLNK